MAFRRSVTARAKLLYQSDPTPFPLIHPADSDNQNLPPHRPISNNPAEIPNYNFISRPPGTGNNLGNCLRSRNLSQHRNVFAIPAAFSPVFVRNMSSFGVGPPADESEIMTDVADVLGDRAADVASQVAPAVNEVAVAAADSFFPVAAVQHLIDYVHVYTGFNWWASIVLTTVLIRTFQLPLMINQLKATSQFTSVCLVIRKAHHMGSYGSMVNTELAIKVAEVFGSIIHGAKAITLDANSWDRLYILLGKLFLPLLRPRLEEIKEEMTKDMNPTSMAEGRSRMKELFKEYGVTPFTPLKGVFIVGPVFFCFFLGISNMAEKVQSFNNGGTLWFTDLSTPDSLYILPILTALSFWITVECNAQEGMEGNPAYSTIKNVARAFAALLIPLTATFPNALFCYWITSNLYSLAYGLVIKSPQVKKMLGIPIIPVTLPSTDNKKPPVSFLEALKKHLAAQQKQSGSSPPADASSNPENHQKTSILSQRIKRLEEEVKGRKKGE